VANPMPMTGKAAHARPFASVSRYAKSASRPLPPKTTTSSSQVKASASEVSPIIADSGRKASQLSERPRK
jgi:hypothetical protein